MNFIKIYHFLPKKVKVEKFEKLVANLHDKTEYVIHTHLTYTYLVEILCVHPPNYKSLPLLPVLD